MATVQERIAVTGDGAHPVHLTPHACAYGLTGPCHDGEPRSPTHPPSDDSSTVRLEVRAGAVLGGAMARVPGDATAFGWRDRPALLWLITPDTDLARAAANEAWTAAFRAELPADGPATYVTFMGDEGADAVRDAYPASSYARLLELKGRYDPDNVFRANHNIRPA
jgi:hypothetical protein